MINTYSQVKKEINPQAENGLENGLVGYGVVIRTERFPVQTLLCARQGLGTQPCYEAPSYLQVKNEKTQ